MEKDFSVVLYVVHFIRLTSIQCTRAVQCTVLLYMADVHCTYETYKL